MPNPAIQLHTLRNVDQPLPTILERVASAGFEGVEFAGRVAAPETDIDAVAATLADTGLSAAGAHVDIERLEDGGDEALTRYDRLEVAEIVVPWLEPEHFSARDRVEAVADRLTRLDERIAADEKRLHYHNHDQEYTPVDGEPAFDSLIAGTTFGIELDVGWAAYAGDEPATRLRELGSRAHLVHLKDFDLEAGESVPLGAGDLDLAAIADAAAAVESDWLIYEYEGPDPLATVDEAASLTRELC